MKPPIVFMYSGQGSHYYQMGKALFEQNKIFRHYLEKADAISGLGILQHLYDDHHTKSQPLLDLKISHPAIFIIEYALTHVLLEKNIRPDFVLGSSVGEFAAAVTAGAIEFETALQAVIQQAESITRHCQHGAMIAVIENTDLFRTKKFLYSQSELAAINFPTHFVISTNKNNLNKIEQALKEEKFTYQVLPVNFGFHASYIDPAKKEFVEYLSGLSFKSLSLPLISCVDGNPLKTISYTHFWDCIREPILFQKTIQHMEANSPFLYIDLSPSSTLATFLKYNLTKESKSQILGIMTMFGDDVKNLEKVLNPK